MLINTGGVIRMKD